MIAVVRRIAAQSLGQLCAVLFLVLVLDVLWGVWSRFLLDHQAPWSEELARFLLVWLAMVGAALAYIENRHLGVDVLTRLLDPEARRAARLITHTLILLFSLSVMVTGGVSLFLDRWESGQVLPALTIRKAWFYLSVPVSGLLISLFAVDAVMGTAMRKTDDESSDL